ncbi:hypothetical protein FRC10_008588, partial [Ceratobasidium sp. 414]
MSYPAASSTATATTQDVLAYTLLNAETKYFVGRFRVLTSQVQPHPNQRQLSEAWVDSLHQRFLEVGIDRVAFPIKVLLADTINLNDLQHVITANNITIPELPSHLKTLVYHGQHRVAACHRMVDKDEHWWIAEVYQRVLEHTHPAELLTLMHMGNEDEHRLFTSDADRFLAMYRLSCMLRDQQITPEVYLENYNRMVRAVVKDTTRHGLTNLVASEELADAIARALEHPCLRSSFNASTWGKKLVKGRFFKVGNPTVLLMACLIDEMVEQCRLLQGTHTDVSEKPFTLPAASCSWSQLKISVKKKDHPWKELPGGAVATLARVRQRNPAFSSYLNPSGSDDWTIPNTVLLPSVLTSESVCAQLKDMYHLAQHLINIAAGPMHLDTYTSHTSHSSEVDHPVGIITTVLKDKLGGKPSNFPHRIILTMWQCRKLLLEGLTQAGIKSAADTHRDQYKQIIQTNRSWWEILRMFKMSKLPGLGLVVPKVFAQDMPAKNTALLCTIRNKRQAESASLGSATGTMDGPIEPGLLPTTVTQESRSPSLVVDGPDGAAPDHPVDPSDGQGNQADLPAGVDVQDQAGLADYQSELPVQPTKRKRGVDDDSDGAVDHQDAHRRCHRQPPTIQDDYVLEDDLDVGEHTTHRLQVHRSVHQELHGLLNRVGGLTPSNAEALQALLQGVNTLIGTTHMVRVVDALVQRIP